MKTFRIICDTLLVSSILILLSVQASFAVTGVQYKTAEIVFLQILHISLLIASVCNAMFQYRNRNNTFLCITLVPFTGLIIAFVLSFFDISFPVWTFFAFDSYCVMWFFYLLVIDLITNENQINSIPAIVLHTERLTLRPITKTDEADIYEYCANPEVGPNAGWKPHDNRKETRNIMKALFLNKQDIWGIIDITSGKLIGSIGLIADPLRQNDTAAMIGYALSKDYWGKGFMTEACREVLRYAFEDRKISIASVTHYPYNNRSARVIEKCGFTKEGINRRAEVRYDGTVLDKVVYSLTAEEWASKK